MGDSGLQNERPIIFSGPMVRAILERRKCQTRRVMKPQPFLETGEDGHWWLLDRSENGYGPTNSAWQEGAEPYWTYCPYGQPGDRLWARETWKPHVQTSVHSKAIYRADYTNEELADGIGKWKPSIHMPRWASRITLEIVKIRVQRVQEISEEDAKAEGVRGYVEDGCWVYENSLGPGTWHMDARSSFNDLWDSINFKRGFGWGENPWVWVIEFKRVQP